MTLSDQLEALGKAGTLTMNKDEFCRRFVQHMVERAGFDRFANGELVLDYAEENAPTYFETDWQREMGPEECADADISYWGE